MSSTPANAEPGNLPSPKDIFHLFRLPHEIQDLIFFKFDGLAAIKFRQTNKSFYQHPPFLELKKQYIHQHDTSYNKKLACDEYACYLCLSILPKAAFTWDTIHDARSDPTVRFCIPCGVKGKRFIPGHLFNVNASNVGRKARQRQEVVCCIACMDVKDAFCMRCRWCEVCLRDKTVKVERSARNVDGGLETYTIVLENGCEGHQVYRHRKPALEPMKAEPFGPW